MSALVLLGVDETVASHLRRALAEHCRWARVNGVPVPGAVMDLLSSLADGGLSRPSVAETGGASDDACVLLVSYAEVGRRLGVSDRTVRRLVSSGRLPAVDIAGCRRVRVWDLVGFVEGL